MFNVCNRKTKIAIEMQFSVEVNKNRCAKFEITLAARVSLSPDSPTQMFKHNLRICKSRITFLAGSFFIFLAPAGAACVAAGCLK